MARVDLRDVADRLATAGDLTAIGNIVGDACERAVPFGTFNYVVVEPRVSDQPTMIVRSTLWAPEWGLSRFPDMLLALEHDLGGVAAALDVMHAFDTFARWPVETLRDTALLNDHWRPVGSDQQLVAPLRSGGAPVGYFAVARTRKESRFMADDLRFIDELRIQAERAVAATGAIGPAGLSSTLDALSQTFPYPAYLFEPDGRLRWMSDEGAVRLGVDSARLGAGRLVGCSAGLGTLRRRALALASDPSEDAEAGLRRDGFLHAQERLAVRRFGENGTSLLLLAITPAMAQLPGEVRGPRAESLPRLGAAESRVARLAAEGYTVLNIATRLGVSESTVRTHLHRIYVKLGVHGRAELSCALLRGDR